MDRCGCSLLGGAACGVGKRLVENIEGARRNYIACLGSLEFERATFWDARRKYLLEKWKEHLEEDL